MAQEQYTSFSSASPFLKISELGYYHCYTTIEGIVLLHFKKKKEPLVVILQLATAAIIDSIK
jgi:hypothetical protein